MQQQTIKNKNNIRSRYNRLKHTHLLLIQQSIQEPQLRLGLLVRHVNPLHRQLVVLLHLPPSPRLDVRLELLQAPPQPLLLLGGHPLVLGELFAAQGVQVLADRGVGVAVGARRRQGSLLRVRLAQKGRRARHEVHGLVLVDGLQFVAAAARLERKLGLEWGPGGFGRTSDKLK